jgi:hypothetical protein
MNIAQQTSQRAAVEEGALNHCTPKSFWARILKRHTAAACVAAAIVLSACGGGGSSGSASGNAATPATSASAPSASNGPAPATGASSASPGNGASTPTGTSNPSAGGTTTTVEANSMALAISTGVDGGSANLPEVSVTICAPGTAVCQTVDHVLIDTGSTGVRIASAALSPQLLAALPQETVNGAALGACEQFLDGYTWGSMRVADVTLGPKSAASQPLQIFGDTSVGNVPADCSDNSTLAAENTPAAFGDNGVIGVSSALQDCGQPCAQQVLSAAYYACAGGICQNAAVPVAKQAQNVVAGFAQDNNGVVINLPAIGATGAASAAGTLYFGVATQANNAMTGATVLQTNPTTFNIVATYDGSTFPDSFLDSGSNFYFLNDASIALCPSTSVGYNYYCPASTLYRTAALTSATGGALSENFSIANAQTLFTDYPGDVAYDNIAGPGYVGTIDFGLPFFFGRSIAVLNEGQSALGQAGPFTAIGSL